MTSQDLGRLDVTETLLTVLTCDLADNGRDQVVHMYQTQSINHVFATNKYLYL